MIFQYILILCVLPANDAKASPDTFLVKDQLTQRLYNSCTLSKIIKQYLIKYFDDGENFISITPASSTKDHQYFQQDLLKHIFQHSKIRKFTHNILQNTGHFTRDEKNAINLIFIEDSKLLS